MGNDVYLCAYWFPTRDHQDRYLALIREDPGQAAEFLEEDACLHGSILLCGHTNHPLDLEQISGGEIVWADGFSLGYFLGDTLSMRKWLKSDQVLDHIQSRNGGSRWNPFPLILEFCEWYTERPGIVFVVQFS